ncbi:MAG: beta-lactamase family protein [Desulfobacterales bacterium]|nr:beta-lactamase family protein [Desulfobacterales bacterium]
MKIYKTSKVPKDLSSVTTYNAYEETMPSEVGMRNDSVKKIWKSVEDLYKTGIYPAVSICIRKNDKIVLKRAIGHLKGNGPDDSPDAEKILVTPDTPFCLFSASKSVTAMLMHLLNQRGLIRMLDPVCHYIPEFGVHGKDKVRISDLICHKAGIPFTPTGTDKNILFNFDLCVKMLCEMKPRFTPGKHAAYHAVTAGFILGEIVKRVTGKNLNEFMRESIQEPLGLRYFNYGAKKEDIKDIAINYNTGFPVFFPASVIAKRSLGVPWEMVADISNEEDFLNCIIPSGNLISTADESSIFYQLLLNKGEINGVKIFNPITIERAVLRSAFVEIDRSLFFPTPYSLGFILGGSPVGIFGPYSEKSFGHLGFSNILCWADPDRNISVAIMSSGKPLFGHHLPLLVKMIYTICSCCK